jgi:hypothetical protein
VFEKILKRLKSLIKFLKTPENVLF